MSGSGPHDIIAAIRADIEQAADALLAAAEKGLRDMKAARAGEVEALERIEQMLSAILEACAFQDLAGQRLTKLSAMIAPRSAPAIAGDPLLNGPAEPGTGLDQAAADAILNGNSA